MPVVITNDVRAATFGEWRRGAGQGVNDLVCLFIGTGIGGGIVSGGQLLEGCRNSAGELGHLTIVKDGRRCRCHNRGCLEAYAGGWAIAERAQEAIRADPKAGRRLVSLAETIPQISAATVSRASQDGDSLSIRLMAETVQYLVAGIVSIANIFNPCLLVLGGSVTLGLTAYLAAIKSAVQENALPSAGKSLNIVTAALGDKAGVIGAASLVQEQFK
jgi:glucokinase